MQPGDALLLGRQAGFLARSWTAAIRANSLSFSGVTWSRNAASFGLDLALDPAYTAASFSVELNTP
ncbi:MAG: hypothetical protein R3E75_04990 [Steroidobacteraceae bacterium]